MARQQVVRRAVLVGINQYADPRANLKGCVNDVLLMGKTITEHFGFKLEDIRLLVDRRATTASIRSHLKWLVDGAGPGSVLLFHYSGHGSQVRDRNGDELSDHRDEILCPHDLDWNDPLTDDELGALIGTVPDGVNFTLVLDCCHSGTATREFFKEPEQGTSTSRFLVPPPDIAFRMAAGVEVDISTPARTVNMSGFRADAPRRRFGTSLMEQNAILLAGCTDAQTSADAWIDGDWHGAFTYSLVQSMTRRYTMPYSSLVEASGSWLTARNYEQLPQLEARSDMKAWTFLGSDAGRTTGVIVPTRGLEDEFAPDPATSVVFVHGIGNHVPGYSEPWRNAFNRYLRLPRENFVEVVWDDVFDARSGGTRALAPTLSAREEQLAADLRDELRDLLSSRNELAADLVPASSAARAVSQESSVDRVAERGLVTWLLNFDEYIGDFAKYLVSERVREAVDGRLSEKLDPLLQRDAPVVLITHSWGTVVAHHTLRALTNYAPALHCTLGSPLWMPPVRKILEFDASRSGTRRWINIEAQGDLVGGPLLGKYAVDEDRLVATIGSGNAHGSYFDPANQAVQRDIVARAVAAIRPRS